MRPDPRHQQSPTSSDRIIYLGDVRRRRAIRKRAPDRQYLAALFLVAAVAWAAWLTVLFTVQPMRLLTYVAFLAPLWVALTSTGSIVAYAAEWRRGMFPGLRVCVRRGALAASVIELNLALRAAHHWSLPVLAATIAVVILMEAGLIYRTR